MNDTVKDMDNLRHMLGIGSHISKRDWGYRNHFDAGACDLPSMLRLKDLGLVEQAGRGTVYYATEAGRAAVGLSETQYQRKRA